MSNCLLSILIPITPDRIDGVHELLKVMNAERMIDGLYDAVESLGGTWICKDEYQFEDGTSREIIIWCDPKTMTIGEKREQLYRRAGGVYSWQIDSDDLVSNNAIEKILEAIKSNPEVDVITFEEYCNMDGVEYKSNHSGLYHGWEGDGSKLFEDDFHFHRTPYFKSVIRTALAKSVSIPHCRWGEDNMFADALLPLIKSEIHIPEQLYRYIHTSSDPTERYGLDR